MRIAREYSSALPPFIRELCRTPELQRLRRVGMNCGCEYTSFPRFRKLGSYSRFDHSLGTARIVWRFTEDPVQTAAALFHDIATPVFAHSVDFLRGDYLRQEATEAETGRIIRSSEAIGAVLKKQGIEADAVVDYHCYPIADNDAPRLSADRLEYTLGNLENFGIRPLIPLRLYYRDICTAENEDGMPELAFRDSAAAVDFGFDALRCSRIYVSDEDRYSMQMLSELLGRALARGVLTEDDLMTTEPEVIRRLKSEPLCAGEWKAFRSMQRMIREEENAPEERRRVIPAKKRCIDPLVCGKGRLSQICSPFAEELKAFLEQDQSGWLCAE